MNTEEKRKRPFSGLIE
jgi:hypothetical protein